MPFSHYLEDVTSIGGVENSRQKREWKLSDRSMKAMKAEAVPLTFYPLVLTTWMSRSRIFFRSVFRFTPSRSAARIWLPRVAANAAVSSGTSISRRIHR